VAVEARNLAPLPGEVDFTVGASLPISGLTVWQGLFERHRARRTHPRPPADQLSGAQRVRRSRGGVHVGRAVMSSGAHRPAEPHVANPNALRREFQPNRPERPAASARSPKTLGKSGLSCIDQGKSPEWQERVRDAARRLPDDRAIARELGLSVGAAAMARQLFAGRE